MSWLMLLPVLLWKMVYHMGRCYYPYFIIWQMLLPFFLTVVGVTLHYMYSLIKAGVIAKWQDGTATFLCFKDGRHCCHVVRRNSHFYIEGWQMLLPYGRWNSHCIICDGRYYGQVVGGITTQSG